MRRRSSVCCRSASSGLVAVGDVAGDLRSADGRARRRLDRGNAERDLDRAAVLAQAHRFVVLDAFAPADPAQGVLHLALPVGGHDDRDVLPDRFRRGVAEQAFGGRIPAGDRAVERHRDDGVVGGFDRRAEQALALGMVVARRIGAAMLLQPRVRARRSLRSPPPSPAQMRARARRSRRRHRPEWRPCRRGRRPRRPRSTGRSAGSAIARSDSASAAAHSTAIRPTGNRAVLDRRRRRHEDGVRDRLDERDPFAAGQNGGRERDAAGLPVLGRVARARLFVVPTRLAKYGQVAPPVGRRAQLRAEFARRGRGEPDSRPCCRPHRRFRPAAPTTGRGRAPAACRR